MNRTERIRITEEQKRLLDKLKVHPKQPYYEILDDLLKPLELPVFTSEEKKEFIEKIQLLRSAARKRLEKRKGGEKR